MSDDREDALLVGPKAQPGGADQHLLLPLTPSPAAEPSPPSAGATETIHLNLTVPAGTAEAAHRTLAAAGDKIGPMIGELLGLPAPAPPKPKRSSREAQALAAGLLLGLSRKYGDENMSRAGEVLQAQALGSPTAVVDELRRRHVAHALGLPLTAPAANPPKSKSPKSFRGNPRSKGKSKGKR